MGKKGLNMASKESYDSLSNLPSINGVTLEGNLTTQQLNVDKHFKGWWPDLATLKAAITATAGDAAYVKDASPATTWSIYVYDATATTDNYWADSGTDADTSNVQTFASGEEVNETYIDDTHLVNPAEGSLPKAEDVKDIKDGLYGYYNDSIVSSTDYYSPYMTSTTIGTYCIGGSFELDGNNKYYWKGSSVGTARTNYIPTSVLATIKGTFKKLRVKGGPSSTNYAARVMFAKKALPQGSNLTFQQLSEDGYICEGFTEDDYIITISTLGNLPDGKVLVIPDDAQYFYAVRVTSNNQKREPSSIIPFSSYVKGDIEEIQEDIEELQQGIPDGSVTTEKIAEGAVTEGKLAEGAVDNSLVGSTEEYMSFNLLDFGSIVTGTYLDNGVVKTGVSSSYAATTRIPLQGKKVWFGGTYVWGNYGSTKGAAVFASNGTLIRSFSVTNSAIGSYDPNTSGDEGAAYIQLTMVSQNSTLAYVVYAKEDGTNPMEDQASLMTGAIDDFYKQQVIKNNNMTSVLTKESVPEVIPSCSYVGQDGYQRHYDAIGPNQTSTYGFVVSTDYPSFLKCCHTISFKAYLSEEMGGSNYIRFGIGRNSTTGKVIDITPTQVLLRFYYNNSYVTNLTMTHNLTIADFVICELTFGWHGGKVRIVTGSGAYIHEWTNTQLTKQDTAQLCYGRAFIEPSVELTDVRLTQSSDRFRKPVWVIGDSYTSMYPQRWTYQMVNTFGIDGFLLDGYAGAPSLSYSSSTVNVTDSMIYEAKRLLMYGTPKYLVWCLGLNDGAVIWKYCLTELEMMCRERGITLVLQTLPYRTDVPEPQPIINEYVKESGYRYIDAFHAVCKDDGTWYDGMKEDAAHPTVIGAKALAGQVLVDFPEIANYK